MHDFSKANYIDCTTMKKQNLRFHDSPSKDRRHQNLSKDAGRPKAFTKAWQGRAEGEKRVTWNDLNGFRKRYIYIIIIIIIIIEYM